MEHIDLGPWSNQRESDKIYLGDATLRTFSIVVWTRENAFGNPDQALRPVVVVISGGGEDVLSKIIKHYRAVPQDRWERLNSNQLWVYLDLNFLFTRWNHVFAIAKRNLMERIEEIHGHGPALSILDETRVLHIENNVMISLRELVRIQQESMRKLADRVNRFDAQARSAMSQLQLRVTDALRLFNYYELKATTLLEQQQNLLGLALNLETHRQGQAVARLNALAFTFLPLSFVASIFGITTFTVAAKWYPVFAIPLFLLTLFIAYAANSFLTPKQSPPGAVFPKRQPESDSKTYSGRRPSERTTMNSPMRV